MDTVLFTDNGILVFAMTTGAIALMLMLAVLGLATTHRTRSDIEHQWLPAGFSADSINRQLRNMSGDAELNEWNLLLNQFHALVRKGSDSSAVIFDDPFRHRISGVIAQAARPNWPTARRQG
jgi:hypothetical protein